MGLDMFLYDVTEIGPDRDKWPQWVWNGIYDRGDKTVRVAKLRKFNALHRWFVTEIQGGVDECEMSRRITADELKGLLAALKAIVEEPSEGPLRLPVQPGYFFGSTEYGTWYEEEVRDAIPAIENAIKLTEAGRDLRYLSSW